MQPIADMEDVREFDKDEFTFILRDADHKTIRKVSFSESQYDDALLAFDSEKPVTIVAYETSGDAELVSMTFSAVPGEGDDEDHPVRPV
jgi:hypothetical protein